jgi:hypothetical protein
MPTPGPFVEDFSIMKQDKQKNQIKGLLFIGPMFVGMGLGFIFGNIPAGLFSGMGLGFAFQALFMIAERDKQLARERLPEDDYAEELDPHFHRGRDPFEDDDEAWKQSNRE